MVLAAEGHRDRLLGISKDVHRLVTHSALPGLDALEGSWNAKD